jgi:hypothetical protein
MLCLIQEKICIAEENKQPPPPLTLNLPPGYLRVKIEQLRNIEDCISSEIIKTEEHSKPLLLRLKLSIHKRSDKATRTAS